MIKSSLSFHNVECSVHAPNSSVPSCILGVRVPFDELLFSMSALSHPSTIQAARSHLNLSSLHEASIPLMAVQEQRVRKSPSLLAVPAVLVRSYIYSNTFIII